MKHWTIMTLLHVAQNMGQIMWSLYYELSVQLMSEVPCRICLKHHFYTLRS